MAEIHFDRKSLRPDDSGRPWYADMTRYHWFVLLVAALGWLFDCLDQQLFTLARTPAMKDLLKLPASDPAVKNAAGWVTSVFLVGWATGGLFFGVLGDRIGRAKTMMLTILLYSVCTGLSALSVSVWDFGLYRFLTGLGVGGEFAVGVALVAEVMPERARARSLSLLQALSAIGNISAALISMGQGELEQTGVAAWRVMFLIGAAPALLAVVIRRRLKEPERWQQVSHEGEVQRKLGSYAELFRHPTWRKHAIIGLLLASSGVIGLWGIGFFIPELSRAVFRPYFADDKYKQLVADAEGAGDNSRVEQLQELWTLERQPASPGTTFELSEPLAGLKKSIDDQISGRLTSYASLTLLMQQLGAFLGMYTFGWLAQRIGRRLTFLIAFTAALISTAWVFWYLNRPTDIFWMVPIMGYFQLSLFAGYAIYFPELFPTYLRSTGTSFCYNVGRFLAAMGPAVLVFLASDVYGGYAEPLPWRYAGVTMCAIFLLGIFTLPFAPETKDRPLPE